MEVYKLKSIAFIALFGIATLGLTAPSAHAVLIEQDLNAAGDKLITLDTASGLQWLDVTATLGLSYNMAVLTSFVTAQGFRHANRTEVAALYFNTGVTIDQTGIFVAANFAGVQELLLKLGCTFRCGGNFELQQGWADNDLFSSSISSGPFVSVSIPNGSAQAIATNSGLSKNFVSSGTGSYLVRTVTVPEPSTLLLFGFGLAGLAGFARRRRQA